MRKGAKVFTFEYVKFEMCGDMEILSRQLLSGKESACQFRRCKRCKFDLWVGKMPGRRKWPPTPVFLL